jgi:hypothetical protein
MSVACTLSGTTYTYNDIIAIGSKNSKLEEYITKCNALYNKPGNTVSNVEKCTITISGANMGNIRRFTPATLTKDNFDWNAYVSKYVDLQKAGINTLDKAWNHYTKYGRGETRIARTIAVNTEEHKTTADLHAEISANNRIISACIPTPSRLTLDAEINAGNILRSEYDDLKAKRAKADSLKRELAPEHRYTRENQFEDPLYLETLNAEWNGWAALVFAATAGTVLVYAFISSSTK